MERSRPCGICVRLGEAVRPLAQAGALLFVALAPEMRACDEPVFQWALERWGPEEPGDCYTATVFRRGALDPAAQKAFDGLKRRSWSSDGDANIIVREVDLEGKPDPAAQALWDSQAGARLPWIVLNYPAATRIGAPFWSGPLSEDSVNQLLDSPLRRRIAKGILGGDAAVWLLVGCGDAEKDGAASKALEKRLAELEKTLELPEVLTWDFESEPGSKKEPPPPMHPSFSIDRVLRSDAGEAVLLSALLRSDPDLEKSLAKEPIVFPIFGRGRALYPLAGKGITDEHIEEACLYLVGSCSCEAKLLNPGLDLLMSADWSVAPRAPRPSDLLAIAAAPEREVKAGEASREGRRGEAGLALGGEDPSGDEASWRRRLLRGIGIALGLLVLVTFVAAGLLLRKRRSI